MYPASPMFSVQHLIVFSDYKPIRTLPHSYSILNHTAYHFHHDKQISIKEWETWKGALPDVGDHSIQFGVDLERVFTGSSPYKEQWYEDITPFVEMCTVLKLWEQKVCYPVIQFELAVDVTVLGNLYGATARHTTYGTACCTAGFW